ncbi:hypothetical protein [Halomonas sp. HL-93]|uniref:hypothetical protein n=1 Tax=Halomonas sp. HL-93 TaxID=1666906 RepID=UPI0006DA6C35|nr:hypothetical protein [Halomonas sp. HL-93]KPQ26460.1 MAG: putative membrane protein [Halomonas sp. HL-93]SBR50850.1 hypothetical protein GA0071314_2891 [Halomonas sp. HL-93]
MTRMLPHRMLLAAEMLLLALPITLLCGLLGVGVVLANAFPWWEQIVVIHFVLLGLVGMAGLWRVALATTWPRQQRPVYSAWWWRAACLGAGLLGVPLLLYGLILLGWEPAEWVVVMAAGVYTMPLLVSFLHVAYCRRVLMSAN